MAKTPPRPLHKTFRLAVGELATLEAAARAADQPLGTYVLDAALARARGEAQDIARASQQADAFERLEQNVVGVERHVDRTVADAVAALEKRAEQTRRHEEMRFDVIRNAQGAIEQQVSTLTAAVTKLLTQIAKANAVPPVAGATCPVCKTGHLVEANDKAGKPFLHCSRAPECKHWVWKT